jgi:cytochrome c-type biogenesis protein
MPAIERAMGVLLVGVGLMMLTGGFSRFSFWLLDTFPALALIG